MGNPNSIRRRRREQAKLNSWAKVFFEEQERVWGKDNINRIANKFLQEENERAVSEMVAEMRANGVGG